MVGWDARVKWTRSITTLLLSWMGWQPRPTVREPQLVVQRSINSENLTSSIWFCPIEVCIYRWLLLAVNLLQYYQPLGLGNRSKTLWSWHLPDVVNEHCSTRRCQYTEPHSSMIVCLAQRRSRSANFFDFVPKDTRSLRYDVVGRQLNLGVAYVQPSSSVPPARHPRPVRNIERILGSVRFSCREIFFSTSHMDNPSYSSFSPVIPQ